MIHKEISAPMISSLSADSFQGVKLHMDWNCWCWVHQK